MITHKEKELRKYDINADDSFEEPQYSEKQLRLLQYGDLTMTLEDLDYMDAMKQKEEQDKAEAAEMQKFQEDRLPALKELNDYMQKRKDYKWAQNYDEYSKLADRLNQRFMSQYRFNKQKGINQRDSEWESLIRKAESIQEKVQTKDANRMAEVSKTEYVWLDLQEELEKLANDHCWTDSKPYQAVLAAAAGYLQADDYDKKMAMAEELRKTLNAYADIRYKKNGSITPKGIRRMKRVDKILGLLGMLSAVKDYQNTRLEQGKEYDNTTKYMKQNPDNVMLLEKAQKNNPKLSDTSRVIQLLKKVETDKYGEITEEGEKTYQDNLETVEMLGQDDYATLKAALCKIYLNLDVLKEFSTDNLNTDQLLKLSHIFRQQAFTSAYNSFNDVFSGMKGKYAETIDDKLMNYMNDRVGNMMSLLTALEAYMVTQGIRATGILRFNDVNQEGILANMKSKKTDNFFKNAGMVSKATVEQYRVEIGDSIKKTKYNLNMERDIARFYKKWKKSKNQVKG